MQADTQLAEAQRKADTLVNDAEIAAKNIIDEANKKAVAILLDAENKSQTIKDDILGEVRHIERDFKTMQNHKENLLVQLRSLANTTVEHVDRFEARFNPDLVAEKIAEVKNILPEEEITSETPQNEIIEQVEAIPETPQITEQIASEIPQNQVIEQ